MQGGSLQARLTGHVNWVWDVAFSAAGEILATAGYDGRIQLWRTSDWSVLTCLTGHTGWVCDIAFSPDGALLASAGYDGSIRVWNVGTWQTECAIRVTAPIFDIAWHPNSGELAAAGEGGVYLLQYLS
jgi:WD40 repeat protein